MLSDCFELQAPGHVVPCTTRNQVTDQLVSNSYHLVPTYLPTCTNLPINSYPGLLLVVVLFAPIWGGSLGICSVCWMLCTALSGSTSQQSSKGSCSLLVSGHNLLADCQCRTLVPPLTSGANAAPASVLALM